MLDDEERSFADAQVVPTSRTPPPNILNDVKELSAFSSPSR
jgi:hypothetical protein